MVGQSQLDRLGAVPGLGDDLQVGLGVKDELESAADERVVVGQEDPRLEGDHAWASAATP